jgi:two-component system repressor protein LuxO
MKAQEIPHTNHNRPSSILLVEDSPSMAVVYQGYLAGENYIVSHVETGKGAIAALRYESPDVVLLDLNLPDMSGMDILRELQETAPGTSVIVITAHGSVDTAVDAMRFGAFDFLVKPFDGKRLKVTISNAVEQRKLREIVETYHETFDRDRYHGFIGGSLAMQAVYRIIDSASPSKATVFITGESGTGKEVCAEAIHMQSQRRDKPFVALNCAAIPRDLMEAEIFGHTKGAFTGAVSERKGAAEQANGGTLFLDEICEMDLELQSKLLRFAQTGTFQRVGSGKVEKVDVRFICATNRDPLQEVEAGRFREDLFYRLHVIPLPLPPLREREGDTLLIARQFLTDFSAEEGKRFTDFAPEAEKFLSEYDWPGNVRELQNVIRNAVVLNDGEQLTVEMLPTMIADRRAVVPMRANRGDSGEVTAGSPDTITSISAEEVRPLWQLEKEIIERTIEICDGNIPKAAALLEISASTIYRKKQAWSAESCRAG